MKDIATVTNEFVQYCQRVANDYPRTEGATTTYTGNTYHGLTFDQIHSLITQQEAYMRDAWNEIRRYTAWLQGYGRTPSTDSILRQMRESIKY